MKHLLIAVSALFLLLCLGALAPAAYAQDSNYSNDSFDPWQTRGSYEYHVYSLLPLDWPEAHTTAPADCAMTPAQAEKYRCKTMIYQGRPYYYYENEKGQVYVRRPITWVYSTPVAVR